MLTLGAEVSARVVLPEPEISPTADQDTDEEPIEEAKIEEHEEEGDFLEDFPDDTEVASTPVANKN
jgi:protein phosphatase 1 regulatory subunit 7